MEEYNGICYYEFEILNACKLNKIIYTPRFETSPNIFWQLGFKPTSVNNPEYCALILVAIRNQGEINKLDQVRRNVFPFKIILKSLDDVIIKERERIFLENENISRISSPSPFPKKDLPKDLISLWASELLNPYGADTRITVDGQYLYAKSSILKKRSEYFQTMLDGPWMESNPNDEMFVYNIEITDFNYSSVFQMLSFLYTDQVQLNNNNDIWELYGVANKYLITELEEKIKAKIFRGINNTTCAENLFRHAWKWSILKDEFMKYMVQNFNTIRNTNEFKMIIKNKDDYPMFHQLSTEILLEYVPETPEKSQDSSELNNNDIHMHLV
ncbi:BTB/POZ protein [Glomus cerebriforme]|uniref:BTB/POZ protein n=1 Tax=Glomus cerebriforme TaxID=658196 RepID=A0A397STN0_9GLOM|nr:BTB/POZ protein [Glomus cerebriforme]RIA89082.1 BTB/POZ protein [Glomus cerebriforme]